MIVYRLTKAAYKDDISGTGAKLYGSRWNTKGQPMLFAAEHISLAALEMLVHVDFTEMPDDFQLLYIKLPDQTQNSEIKNSNLKLLWKHDEDYTAFMGDEFLRQQDKLYLKVPSAVIPEEHNFIINPVHKDFKKVKIIKSAAFTFDKRLI